MIRIAEEKDIDRIPELLVRVNNVHADIRPWKQNYKRVFERHPQGCRFLCDRAGECSSGISLHSMDNATVTSLQSGSLDVEMEDYYRIKENGKEEEEKPVYGWF